jgi:hypothetical protein
VGYGLLSAFLPCAGFIIGLINYSSSRPRRGGACLAGALLGMVGGCMVLSPVANTPSYSGPSTSFAPSVPSFSTPTLTMAKYNQIQNGMSYSQVVGIIGQSGVEMSRNRMEGVAGVMPSVDTVMYMWQNDGGLSNMNAMFQNDRLISKAQFGLP